MTDKPLPKLMPHKDVKGLYLAHLNGAYVGEVSRLRERQFLVRNAARQNLTTECESLSAAQWLLAQQ